MSLSHSLSSQCIDVHLKFMAFLLQDGALYIPAKRAFDIWDTLIANPNACDMDRKVSYVGSVSGVKLCQLVSRMC